MEFVYDDRLQRGEQEAYLLAPADEERLQRSRRDQHDPARILTRPRLGIGRHVAVPFVKRYIAGLTQWLEPTVLVVDQRLERADIEDAEAIPPIAVEDAGEQGQDRRFRLSRGGPGRHDDVAARQNGGDRLLLHVPEPLPFLRPDPAPDRLAEALKGGGLQARRPRRRHPSGFPPRPRPDDPRSLRRGSAGRST